jgi:hypothetical protein
VNNAVEALIATLLTYKLFQILRFLNHDVCAIAELFHLKDSYEKNLTEDEFKTHYRLLSREGNVLQHIFKTRRLQKKLQEDKKFVNCSRFAMFGRYTHLLRHFSK